jgi:uncharacterized protein YigE (DUF2233 family)
MPIVRRIAFLLAAVTSLTVYDYSALADTGPCRSIEYERAAYAVCEVDLHKHTVQLYWNIKSGRGNFHMKPNGIFYISAHGAAVAETQAFLKQRPQAYLATQSGPMLVIDGHLHPRFDRHSTSLKARTGVGVRADGKVIFAISEDAVVKVIHTGRDCACDSALRLTPSHAYSVMR